MQSGKRSEFWGCVLAALLGGVAVLGADLLTVFDTTEAALLDWRFIWRGQRPAPPEIVMVTLDDRDAEASGTPLVYWGHNLATALARLSDLGATAIGFDLAPSPTAGDWLRGFARRAGLQEEKALEIDPDLELRQVAARTKQLVLAESFVLRGAPRGGPPNQPQWLVHARGPEPLTQGFSNLDDSIDGVVRRQTLIGDGEPPLSLTLQLLATAEQATVEMDQQQRRLRVGRRQAVLDEKGRLLIDWVGPPGSFDQVRLLELVAEDAGTADRLRSRIEGRIALVGHTGSTEDLYATPFSRAASDTVKSRYMSGVEVHANVLATLLAERPLRRIPGSQRAALLLLLAFVAGFVAAWLRVLPGVATALGFGALWCAAVWSGFAMALWVDIAAPVAAIVVASAAAHLFRYVVTHRSRERLERAFKGFVSDEVVDGLSKGPIERVLRGETRRVSVLFADIRDFTPLAERLSAEQVFTLLNEYLGRMADVIVQYGGYVDKFMGDGIMAVFGAPADQPDHAARAVRAGLAMVRAAEELRHSWCLNDAWRHVRLSTTGRKDGLKEFRIGVGIQTGEVATGLLGSQLRYDYAVVGDTVNVASRIESANKKTGTCLLIGAATHDAVRDLVVTGAEQSVSLKGKSEEITVHEVIALRGSQAEKEA